MGKSHTISFLKGRDTETNREVSKLTVDSDIFAALERASEKNFRKSVPDLTFDEASKLVGSFMLATTPAAGVIKDRGVVAVEYEQDGEEAFRGAIVKQARELAPHIDDDREIYIQVVKNTTLWERIRGRQASLEQVFHYYNEPVEYV